MDQFKWYLPSVYGDISLTRVTAEATTVTLVGLSPTEKRAVSALLERAIRPGVMQSPWATEASVREVDLGSLKEQQLALAAPISQVQTFLQKQLKPHRKQVSAVRFTNGRVEELSEATLKVIDGSPSAATTAAASSAVTAPSSPLSTPVKTEKPKPQPEKAVTVSQPTIGCPAPDFDDVEVRANRVLCAFLSPEQVEDFNTRQQFVTTGADTGHRYLLTSRTARRSLQLSNGRSLYDIDESMSLCVHDWEVPPAEELLALFVHLSIPGLEGYVRSIPDRGGILHGG